jgi:hypothetical protein
MKIRDFLILGLIWHLEGFGSMENTPTGCGSHLPTNLRILKNDRKSISVNDFLECSDLDLNSVKEFLLPAKAPPRQFVVEVDMLSKSRCCRKPKTNPTFNINILDASLQA